MKKRYVIGIDEVGRGPLAGPVTVAAVALPATVSRKYLVSSSKYTLPPLRDSKRLTGKQREKWYRHLKNHSQIQYAVCHVQPSVIDRMNIREAANLAATRAFEKLLEQFASFPSLGRIMKHLSVLLDGGLYLNDSGFKIQDSRTRTVIRGDEKYIAIKLASIVAKVRRDRLMIRYHKRYPKFGFHIHKGYGTKAHMKAVRKHGVSAVHRQSFLKNI